MPSKIKALLGFLGISAAILFATSFFARFGEVGVLMQGQPPHWFDLGQVMAFSGRADHRVTIGFQNGSCITSKTRFSQFKKWVKLHEKGKYFEGIPDPNAGGRSNDFINLLYIKAFLKYPAINGKGYEYRARLDFSDQLSSDCRSMKLLKKYGTAKFSQYVYDKMVRKMAQLNIADEGYIRSRMTRLVKPVPIAE